MRGTYATTKTTQITDIMYSGWSVTVVWIWKGLFCRSKHATCHVPSTHASAHAKRLSERLRVHVSRNLLLETAVLIAAVQLPGVPRRQR